MKLLVEVRNVHQVNDMVGVKYSVSVFNECKRVEGRQYIAYDRRAYWADKDDLLIYEREGYKVVCYHEWKRLTEEQL